MDQNTLTAIATTVGMVAGWLVRHFFPGLFLHPAATPAPAPTPASQPATPSSGNAQIDALLALAMSVLQEKLAGKPIAEAHKTVGAMIAALADGKQPEVKG